VGRPAPGSSTLTYRYASFEATIPARAKSESYDPLFYGFNDWGYWYQGEVAGEYVLSNSNLLSHMIKLNVKPIESVSRTSSTSSSGWTTPRRPGSRAATSRRSGISRSTGPRTD